MYPPYQLPIYHFYCFAAKHNAADFFNHIMDFFLLPFSKRHTEKIFFLICVIVAHYYATFGVFWGIGERGNLSKAYPQKRAGLNGGAFVRRSS